MRLLLTQPKLQYAPDADNAGVVERLLAPYQGRLERDDIVVLPEHFDLRASRSAYETTVTALARRLGCHVVGGSHHEDRADAAGTKRERVNSGIVAGPDGSVLTEYEKLRPYAEERSAVKEGGAFGEVRIGGHPVLILICADFWFSDVFYRTHELPDLVLVPALSVSRKPTPDYSRALWTHLAVARAYEFGAYVGVSDWAHRTEWVQTPPSGVGGFADPTTADPAGLYRTIQGDATLFDLDWPALERFRTDRVSRGFFWKKPVSSG
jgi:predicted amidohydrolase